MSFSSVVAVALGAVLTATSPVASSTPLAGTQFLPQAQTVEQYVDTYFQNEPVMIAIAGCESHFEQYGSDGDVLHNPNSSAVGVFQIMSSIHATKADQELGVDIDTLQGNAAYAQYLYDTQGTAPWNASKACWGKSVAAKDPNNLAPHDSTELAAN